MCGVVVVGENGVVVVKFVVVDQFKGVVIVCCVYNFQYWVKDFFVLDGYFWGDVIEKGVVDIVVCVVIWYVQFVVIDYQFCFFVFVFINIVEYFFLVGIRYYWFYFVFFLVVYVVWVYFQCFYQWFQVGDQFVGGFIFYCYYYWQCYVVFVCGVKSVVYNGVNGSVEIGIWYYNCVVFGGVEGLYLFVVGVGGFIDIFCYVGGVDEVYCCNMWISVQLFSIFIVVVYDVKYVVWQISFF